MIFIHDILCRTGLEASITGAGQMMQLTTGSRIIQRTKGLPLGDWVSHVTEQECIFGVHSIIKCPEPE